MFGAVGINSFVTNLEESGEGAVCVCHIYACTSSSAGFLPLHKGIAFAQSTVFAQLLMCTIRQLGTKHNLSICHVFQNKHCPGLFIAITNAAAASLASLARWCSITEDVVVYMYMLLYSQYKRVWFTSL